VLGKDSQTAAWEWIPASLDARRKLTKGLPRGVHKRIRREGTGVRFNGGVSEMCTIAAG